MGSSHYWIRLWELTHDMAMEKYGDVRGNVNFSREFCELYVFFGISRLLSVSIYVYIVCPRFLCICFIWRIEVVSESVSIVYVVPF